MTAAVAALSILSCTKETTKVDEVKPAFPTAVNQTLEANGTYSVKVNPNMDWSVELKADDKSSGWFWIQDGNSQVYKVRGKANESATIVVCAGEQTDFDVTHSCTLEMTMNGETKTIATFSRGTVARTFSLSYAKVDGEYDYEYSEDGKLRYAYNDPIAQNGVIPVSWIERTQDYRISLLISANFDWQLKSKPEWLLELKKTSDDAQLELELEGDPYKYPLEDATAEIVFCAKSNTDATFTYKVHIPGCASRFGASGFSETTYANSEGCIYLEDAEGTSLVDAEIGVNGNVTSVEDIVIYKFAYDSAWDNADSKTAWVNIDIENWDVTGTVIQTRGLNIKLEKNAGAERKACVVAIPAAVAPESASEIFPDGQNIDEKYEAYLLTTIIQLKKDGTLPGEGGGETKSLVELAYPDAVSGAELLHVTEANVAELSTIYKEKYGITFGEEVETGYDVSILTFTQEQKGGVTLIIPSINSYMMDKMPYSGAEWLDYSEPWREGGKTMSTIYMEKPSDDQQKFGRFNFYKNNELAVVIFCFPEF